jgi:tRNA 2-selenouridine synthase
MPLYVFKKGWGDWKQKQPSNHLLENNHRECFRVLLKYYDKWYSKGLLNRENLPALLNKIAFPSVEVKTITNILINEKTTAL